MDSTVDKNPKSGILQYGYGVSFLVGNVGVKFGSFPSFTGGSGFTKAQFNSVIASIVDGRRATSVVTSLGAELSRVGGGLWGK